MLAANKVGIDKKNEILAESNLLKPNNLPDVIVMPDLLTPGINEVSIIQAAIGIKEQESKGNKSSILNSILNSEGEELQTYLTEIAVATKDGNTKMETALDLLTKPQVGGSPNRSESFNRNLDKLKKARGES